MKLIDGLKLTGKPVEIPDCSRDDLPEFFVEMGFKVGAEIGVDNGEFSEKIAKSGLKLYSIDPWLYYKDYYHSRGQAIFDDTYEITKKRLAPYPNCTIVRKTSMEATLDFEDESLDFVYIDGNHEFKFVAEDLSEWTKKIRKGGVIAGHDYVAFRPRTFMGGVCHVIPVVNAYTRAYGIRNWYLLGRKNYLPGEKRDRWRSWMFVKP